MRKREHGLEVKVKSIQRHKSDDRTMVLLETPEWKVPLTSNHRVMVHTASHSACSQQGGGAACSQILSRRSKTDTKKQNGHQERQAHTAPGLVGVARMSGVH